MKRYFKVFAGLVTSSETKRKVCFRRQQSRGARRPSEGPCLLTHPVLFFNRPSVFFFFCHAEQRVTASDAQLLPMPCMSQAGNHHPHHPHHLLPI